MRYASSSSGLFSTATVSSRHLELFGSSTLFVMLMVVGIFYEAVLVVGNLLRVPEHITTPPGV